MKLKKIWKRFWTLNRHHEDGFTLVELIVVIAIIGILAGVGTVAYSGYITNANKNADKVLVGNIVRAIETGTNSTMFVPKNSTTFAATVFPVGFISLTKDGTAVMVSNTDIEYVEGECEFVTVDNVTIVTSESATAQCGLRSKSYTKYSISSGSPVTYCKTHTSPEDIAAGIEKLEGSNEKQLCTNVTCTKTGVHVSHNFQETKQTVSNTTIVDTNRLFLKKTETLCELAYAQQYGVYGTAKTKEADASNSLFAAIEAAFGDVGSLRLKYDGWTADEGVSYTTFYSFAGNIFSTVSEKTGLLVEASNGSTPLGQALAFAMSVADKDVSNYLTEGSYDSSADLLDSFATFVSQHYTPSEWDRVWKEAANKSDEYDFEILSRGAKNDYMWAARIAYNTAFASYCDSVLDLDEGYLDLIVNYGETEFNLIDIPSVVNTAAFAKTGNDSLLKDFTDFDSANGEAVFNQCKKLYEESYKESETCKKNGQSFFSTTKSLEATGDLATDKNNGFNGDYFAYYESYMNEMAKLYDEAKKAAGRGGIVIIVEVVGGNVKCEVSPSTANPRK